MLSSPVEGRDCKNPGLYSWWVDDTGRARPVRWPWITDRGGPHQRGSGRVRLAPRLVVRTAVHPDPDVLGELEAAVLRVIDPPLNLRGMTDTPVRIRLAELRRACGRT
jgi:hypothetical protein